MYRSLAPREVGMIRDVPAHLDGGPDDEPRLQHAEAVAATSQAHLTGLFTNPLADPTVLLPTDGSAVGAQVLADLNDDTRQQRDLIQQRLAERFNRLSVPNEIRRLDGFPEELASRAASE